MSKKPRNPNPGAGIERRRDAPSEHVASSASETQVMRKGKTARDRAKRARQ